MVVDINRVMKLTEELKQAQERVKQLQIELARAAMGQPENVQVLGSTLTAINSAGDSLPDRILAVLSANPSWSYKFEALHKEIGGNEAYLRSALSRMTKEGRIESRGWGMYGAKGLVHAPTVKEKAQNG